MDAACGSAQLAVEQAARAIAQAGAVVRDDFAIGRREVRRAEPHVEPRGGLRVESRAMLRVEPRAVRPHGLRPHDHLEEKVIC